MIIAYLTFRANAEEAFNFYKSAFGGEIISILRFGDTPHTEQMSPEDKKKVMHISMESPYGKLMGNDHPDFMGESFTTGNNIALSLHPDNIEEATRLFNGLSEGANIILPLEKVYWGAWFGMFIDRFGIKWMVNCPVKE